MSRILGWFIGSTGAYIAAGLLLAGVGAWGVQTWRLHSLEADVGKERVAWAKQKADAAEAAASAAAAYRAKERAWAKQHEEIVNVAIQKTEAATAAVVAADTAARSLQQRVAALAAAGRAAACRPAAAGAGAPASDPIGMLADVLGRADARAGVLAAYADRARIAGEACQASYEALRR